MRQFFNQQAIGNNAGFQILITLSTQLIGLSLAGLTRAVLVYPASMIWCAAASRVAVADCAQALEPRNCRPQPLVPPGHQPRRERLVHLASPLLHLRLLCLRDLFHGPRRPLRCRLDVQLDHVDQPDFCEFGVDHWLGLGSGYQPVHDFRLELYVLPCVSCIWLTPLRRRQLAHDAAHLAALLDAQPVRWNGHRRPHDDPCHLLHQQ